MITSNMIKDLQPIKMMSSRKLFYLWLVERFGYESRFGYEDCLEYGVNKRQVFRYFADLIEKGMVYKIRGGGGYETELMLDEGLLKKQSENINRKLQEAV